MHFLNDPKEEIFDIIKKGFHENELIYAAI